MPSIFKQVADTISAGEPCVLITIIGIDGSLPRKVGTKMLLLASGKMYGSIGGGELESKAVDYAREMLATHADPCRLELEIDSGRDIKARVELLFETLFPPHEVVIFGAGHVGQAVCRVADLAGLRALLVDDRPELVSDILRFDWAKNTRLIKQLDVPDDWPSLTRDSLVLVSTRSHSLDLAVLRQVLKTEAGYIGLLGSKKKKKAFFDKLTEEGVDEATLMRIHTPVGLDIGAEGPQEIAISIVAEMIKWIHSSS